MTRHKHNSRLDEVKQPVDRGPNGTIKLRQQGQGSRQGTSDKAFDKAQDTETRQGGFTINEDAWHEFILIAQHIYRGNKDSEIADVFEFLRLNDLGGNQHSEALIQRVDREIETDMRNERVQLLKAS